ncbi:MAG: DUF45 domain-containing protein [Candidatus Omnitrophica bacterium]|nr:DUF45 domain-containing protein [Candidatus Omnitrophota bacterium]MBD3269444.1 DUF45 domain-containing protein [Candidatus Omnitrophota bacterium]
MKKAAVIYKINSINTLHSPEDRKESVVKNIQYTVVRSPRRKTLSLTVYPDNKIVVKASSFIPENRIKDFVERKSDWLKRKVEFNSKIRKPYIPKTFREGEKFLYLGEELPLVIDVHLNKTRIFLEEEKIYIQLPQKYRDNPAYLRRKVREWYKMCASEIFEQRIEHYRNIVGVNVTGFKIRSLLRTWGNCSHEGILSLNWKLIMAPLAIIDYVVVHELCHLIHPNHSSCFWEALEAVIPDHKKRREWLVIHENYLKL